MSSQTIRYVLWGSSGHAKVLADIIALRGGKVIALFDNDPKAVSVIPGVPLYIGMGGFLHWREVDCGDSLMGLAAIGGVRGKDRLHIQKCFRKHNVPVGTLVHPNASVCQSSFLGSGSQILAQSVVAADSYVGEACIINHGANVDHECVLGDGVHLAPAATLCGCVTLGDHVMIGAGAVILPRLQVGDNVIVGAGAVVTRDLPSGVVAVGNPARIVRNI
ncbi:MAG: NeuD/PglB/VioB family sugar acetyltransferase [Gammaproteobacteria bacterium]